LDPEPPSLYLELIWSVIITAPVTITIFGLILLILCSALISGSEVAFFSITPSDIKELKDDKSMIGSYLIILKQKPKRLLATILITNNLINILIIILSDYLLRILIPVDFFLSYGSILAEYIPITAKQGARAINFLISVFGVTFILVLFGELLPKIYANVHHMNLARRMARPMNLLTRIFAPLSALMVKWTNRLESKINKSAGTIDSNKKDELEQAIEFSVDKDIYKTDEADLLKGIINFGEVSVKQIMKSRMDIVALDIEINYVELLHIVRTSGFSRFPVYTESLDNIKGILYVKDLLGKSQNDKDYYWQDLIRDNIIYVPETKKIDELLKEFQFKRLHLAIAVDEFGGTSGLVTLEDIMEEIIGEIKDEFDDDLEVEYTKIDDYTYIFGGKVLLNDACRVLGIDLDEFDTVKGGSDSLAGLMLEISGSIPKKNEMITFNRYTFHAINVTKKRIESVKVVMEPIILEHEE